ncbi:hypothetical protein D3C80_1895800 [compost metagenome]
MLQVNITQLLKNLVLPLMQRIELTEIDIQLVVCILVQVHLPDTFVVTQERIGGGGFFYPRLKCGTGDSKRSAL